MENLSVVNKGFYKFGVKVFKETMTNCDMWKGGVRVIVTKDKDKTRESFQNTFQNIDSDEKH